MLKDDSTVSLETLNKKLEAFVDVTLAKVTEQQTEIAKLKKRVKKLEKQNVKEV